METGGHIYHLLSEKIPRSVEKYIGHSLAGQGQDLLPHWLGLGSPTVLLRNDFAPPPPSPTVCTHINIVYPSVPTKIVYYRSLFLHSPLASTCESCGCCGTPLANLYLLQLCFQGFECFHIFLAGLTVLPNRQPDATHADLCSLRNAIVTISIKRALKTVNVSEAVKNAPVWDCNALASLKIAHYIFLNLAVSGASVKWWFCFQHVHVCKAHYLLMLMWWPHFQTLPGLLSPTKASSQVSD